MRPGKSANPTGFRSPEPYLFGGIGAMVFLIALALIILTCSRRKSSNGRSAPTEPSSEKPALRPFEMEPRIVVVMAGDVEPTFLAKPLSLDHHYHVVTARNSA
ncbi:Protein glutamine dumper 2 [Apostasia shenzhenica]|uniref:Protein glutamine dumper 2 n=1 Tax=Apostasia shenzhenica TaxID=1088818 RepID=A0A2I0B3V9_9ASPA|nr:Protein glutamine dumper 2 [Apostasia shenzhenica]